MRRTTEVRIHGVGGSTPEALLGEPHPEDVSLVAGDRQSGFWARRSDPNVQGFVWGRLTSGSPFQALWIVLLPFTLLNVAGWMHRPVGVRSGRVTAIRRVVTVLGVTLTVTWVLWLSVILVDLIAHRALSDATGSAAPWWWWAVFGALPAAALLAVARRLRSIPVAFAAAVPPSVIWVRAHLDSELVRGWAAVAAVALIMLSLSVIAQRGRRRFELVGNAGLEPTHHRGSPRRRATDNEGLDSPCFFDHPKDSAYLLVIHTVVILLATGAVALRMAARVNDGEATISFGSMFIAVGTLQFLLLAALFALSMGEVGQRSRRFRFAGPYVAATMALMLTNAVMGGTALWIRKRFAPGTVIGAELALLDVFVIVVLAVGIGSVARVGYVLARGLSADVPGVAPEFRRSVAIRRRLALAFRNIDLPCFAGAVGIVAIGAVIALTRRTGAWSDPAHWELQGNRGWAWARALGEWAVPLGALAIPRLIKTGATKGGVRRNVGNLWDVLTFWPRRFHPLGVRPYAERAVPQLQARLAELVKDDGRVVVSAHSQGSILAYAALAGLHPRSNLRRIALVTYGSPLSRLHARFFPHYFRGSDYVALRRDLYDWQNFYRRTDHIGQAVFDEVEPDGPHDTQLPDPATAVGDPVPGETTLERDIPVAAGIRGHNDYRREHGVKKLVKDEVDALSSGDLPGPDPKPPAPFAPRPRMVGWFDPRLLALTGIQAVISQTFGSYADKRELEETLEKRVNREHEGDDAEALWIDFVADIGDGFDPTFAIAWHLAKERLTVDGLDLPRGDYLVMGGDQVYPAPSRRRYQNQTIGPYEHAFPGPPGPHPPHILALPGNHDWYDGLTLFIRQFCYPNAIGGWKAVQTRSYFAVKLPNDYWLWAVDTGLGGEIDEPQRRYFGELDVETGDRIILCWAVPVWAHFKPVEADQWEVLRHLVEEQIDGRGAQVVLYLSGDLHHFAHYTGPETHWVTAGGGGAFLHPTHHLDDTVVLPAGDGETTELHLEDCWPDKEKSKRLRRRIPLLFPFKNPAFLIFTSALNMLMAWAILLGRADSGQPLDEVVRDLPFATALSAMFRNPASLLLSVLVVAGFFGFAKPPPKGGNGYRITGAIHGAGHILLALTAVCLASNIVDGMDGPAAVAGFLIIPALVGGIASSFLFGIYLFVTNKWLGMHDNEAFSAIHHPDHKHFLRIRLDRTGLTVHVVALEYVGRHWKPEAASASDEPPCANADRVRPRLLKKIDIPAPARSPAVPAPAQEPATAGPTPRATKKRAPGRSSPAR